MHPLLNDLKTLSDAALENKIIDLQRKYFMTHNAGVKEQIALALDSIKLEMQQRELDKKKSQEDGDSGLDNLINIS